TCDGASRLVCMAATRATAARRRSECRVLELLERTDLDLHGGGLGGEPLLFLREGIDALALRLGRHVDGGDLQQTRQGEHASALFMDGSVHNTFQRGQNTTHIL